MNVPDLVKMLNDDMIRLANSNSFINGLDRQAVKTGWLGYPGASLSDITQKELQLGTTLPPSYKEFLLASNGFRHISSHIYQLYSIKELDWVANFDNRFWLEGIEGDPIEVSDADYSDYSNTQRPEFFRSEYFRDSLQVSDWGDACCLFLNPHIQQDDEWEVLFYATWLPGTRRHRSFKEFLMYTHESNEIYMAWKTQRDSKL